jgi:hypothetical protein
MKCPTCRAETSSNYQYCLHCGSDNGPVTLVRAAVPNVSLLPTGFESFQVLEEPKAPASKKIAVVILGGLVIVLAFAASYFFFSASSLSPAAVRSQPVVMATPPAALPTASRAPVLSRPARQAVEATPTPFQVPTPQVVRPAVVRSDVLVTPKGCGDSNIVGYRATGVLGTGNLLRTFAGDRVLVNVPFPNTTTRQLLHPGATLTVDGKRCGNLVDAFRIYPYPQP